MTSGDSGTGACQAMANEGTCERAASKQMRPHSGHSCLSQASGPEGRQRERAFLGQSLATHLQEVTTRIFKNRKTSVSALESIRIPNGTSLCRS